MMNGQSRMFIIAEAGVNHNGSLSLARELIEAAAEAGADAFKVQTFSADKLVRKDAPCAEYQRRNTGSDAGQYEMLKALELDRAAHHELLRHCRANRIEFMSTGFDPESIEFLSKDVGVSCLKIPSGEAINGVLLLSAYRTGLPLILSTGMCTLDEVLESLSLLAWAAEHPEGEPRSRDVLAAIRQAPGWTEQLRGRVCVLQCVTQYPAPPVATNLRAMRTLEAATGLPVGFSDHSEGWHIAVAAVGAGAKLIEKHFTMSRLLPGPDHAASLEPDELAHMVREIRDAEAALGDGVKVPSNEEIANREPARGSLVAACAIRAGEAFTRDNLTVKRPGTGVSPLAYWDYIGGRIADRDYGADEQIDSIADC